MRFKFSNRIFALGLLMLCVVGCSKTDDSTEYTSIAHLKLMYGGYPVLIKENIVLLAQVTADNSTTNFKGSIIIEDDTGAIEINVPYSYTASDIYVGNIVEVRCQGLCLGGYGGVVDLGLESDDLSYQNSSIPEDMLGYYIDVVDLGSSDNISATEVEIAELTPSMISTMVEIKNLEVIASDSQTLWSTSIDDVVNTLAVDSAGDTITLRVYGYCDFALHLLPSYPINAKGCVGYFNGYQLRLLSYSY